MKQNKGVTLITLMMYVIITLIVLGILGALNLNFRSNLKNVNSNTAQDVEFDKLNVQLLKEIKTENNFIETATATKASITFANGNKYTYSDAEEAVFLNDNIKIAENIKSCAFSVENTDTEQVLKVRTLIGDKGQITEYVMKKKVAIVEEKTIFPGERATENTKYVSDGKTAWIPKGFTVSGISSEQSINNGLVIYDIPEGTTVDWTNPDSVKTQYNQFVWIPVEVNKTTEPKDTETSIASFYRTAWANNASTGGERTTGLNTGYTEPYSYDSSDYDGTGTGKTGISAQITELTKSIYKYGGFYIGRYEAGVKPAEDGISTARTRGSSQTAEFVVQQDKYPYNYVKWGTSMSNVSAGAVYLCNNLYSSTNTNYGATSMLCTGASWDSMLDFIKDSSHSVTDSTTWGNYGYSETYTINRGKYAELNTSNYTLGNFKDVVNEYPKEKGKSILLTTGATERNCSRNIYDVAGNVYEWTTESNSSSLRVRRGRQLRRLWF